MKHDLHSLPLSNSFATLGEAFFSSVLPTPFEQPARLIHFNADAADLLDLEHALQHDPHFTDVFSGKQAFNGSTPLAMLYAGHQFGHYVPQLGDGRAVMLGETTNRRGEKWEMQLKGSGQTPYSRASDGRAVLRSTIREYLCSEAMHGLGIPTTRALCITGSDDEVYRERIETGAMLTRLAPSHVRFGSFEVFYYRDQHEHVRTLADYVIEHHYPELAGRDDKYLALLQTVIGRTARLLAQWQAVGFAHGVMNTDNMSILGLTLDYGPYGFMEAYEPGYICNHSDHEGRYAFNKQPQIGLFNVSCLAQALLPLIEVEAAKAALQAYQPAFLEHYHRLMANKLGFEQADEDTRALCRDLLEHMQQSRADYTTVFRQLAYINDGGQGCHAELRDLFINREHLTKWLTAYRAQLQQQGKAEAARREAMLACNPKYVLRNYMAQVAIEKAERDRDYSEIDALMTILKSPCDEHPAHAHYAAPPPDWAGNIEVSCSS